MPFIRNLIQVDHETNSIEAIRWAMDPAAIRKSLTHLNSTTIFACHDSRPSGQKDESSRSSGASGVKLRGVWPS